MRTTRVANFAIGFIGLLFGASCLGQTFTFTGSNFGPIPNGVNDTNPEGYGAPRDIHFAVGHQRTVSGVSVTFTANHTWVGDLRVSLIAPNGARALLFARTGAVFSFSDGLSSDLNGTYTFSDSAPETPNWWSAAQTNPVPSGSYRTVVGGGEGVSNPPPVTFMMSQFASTPALGRWILRFEDGLSPDSGSVTAASLTLTLTGATRIVTNADDSGPGSLRNRLEEAQVGDYIGFDTSFFASPRRINLLTELPNFHANMAIQGPGAELLTVRRDDTAGDISVFFIGSSLGTASLSGMTISEGRSLFEGGGITAGTKLILSDVHVTGNSARLRGGGVAFFSGGEIINSTISGNTSATSGGGIDRTEDGGPLRIIGSTISGNRAPVGGGISVSTALGNAGIELINSTVAYNFSEDGSGVSGLRLRAQGSGSVSAVLRNSIVANNQGQNFGVEQAGSGTASIRSIGFNLSNDYNGVFSPQPSDVTGDPKLGPLAPQGGTTPTHLLLGGSPALDAGDNTGYTVDQRGAARRFDGVGVPNPPGESNRADIGAVEMQAIVVTNSNDAGAGSLRAALEAANANGPELDDIIFDDAAFSTAQNITLTSALPDIGSALTISGTGADRLSVRRSGAAPSFRIFNVSPFFSIAAFSGMKLQGGSIANEDGGAIKTQGPLTLAGMHILGNLARDGGGVHFEFTGGTILDTTFNGNAATSRAAGIFVTNTGSQTVRLINSTISGNTASGSDGGVFVLVDGNGTARMEVINSTITGNSATITGGLASVSLGGREASVEIRNSIVAGNSGNNLGVFATAGSTATIDSRGFNLSDNDSSAFLDQATDRNNADAGLAPLAMNGGATPTHSLLPSSDALDGGDNSGSGQLFDQRGWLFQREMDQPTYPDAGDGSDIGAFELPAELILPDSIFSDGFE